MFLISEREQGPDDPYETTLAVGQELTETAQEEEPTMQVYFTVRPTTHALDSTTDPALLARYTEELTLTLQTRVVPISVVILQPCSPQHPPLTHLPA